MQVRVLGQNIEIACGGRDERRLSDLAAALDARLPGVSGDAEGIKRLAVTALSLMDEAQAAAAALARAHAEIERLTDIVMEGRGETAPAHHADQRGRVEALRQAQGGA